MKHHALLTYPDNNPTKSAAVITVSSAATYYPGTALSNQRVATTWRSTGIVSEKILVDQGSALPFTCAGILNHNLTSAATVTFKAGSVSDPDGTEFSTTIAWRQHDMIKRFAQQTYRYLSYVIVDTTNTDGYIQLGLALCGLMTLPDYHFDWGYSFTKAYNNIGSRGRYGVPNISRFSKQVMLNLTFTSFDSADDTAALAIHDELAGDLYPVLLMPDRDGTEAYWGRFGSQMTMSRGPNVSTELSFIEDSRGRDMAA